MQEYGCKKPPYLSFFNFTGVFVEISIQPFIRSQKCHRIESFVLKQGTEHADHKKGNINHAHERNEGPPGEIWTKHKLEHLQEGLLSGLWSSGSVHKPGAKEVWNFSLAALKPIV